MSDYGFSINVSGNSIQEMKRIEQELGRLGVSVRDTTKNVSKEFAGMSEELKTVGRTIAEVFAVREIFNFGKEIMNTTAEFEGFENRIRFASINSYDAGQNLSFLRSEVEKLHIPMRQAYESFSEMEAGLVGTGIQGQRLRDLFEGISTAAATLHLPQFQLERTMYDLKEIGEIGINMRIARSLSTALPGIGGIVRETFGKSLHELEKSGISGGDFLAKLGPALKKHFESGLAAWSESLQAQMTDLKNTSLQTVLELGHNLEPVFKRILSDLKGVFNSAPVQLFVENIGTIVSILTKVGGAWLAYKALTLGAAAAEVVFTVATKAMTIASYTAAFGVDGLMYSMEALGVSINSIALGVAGFSLSVIIEAFIDLNKQVEDSLENLTNFKEFEAEFKHGASASDNIVNRFKTARDPEDKSELLTDALSAQKQLQSAIKKNFEPNFIKANEGLAAAQHRFSHIGSWGERHQNADIMEKVTEFSDKLHQANTQLTAVNDVIAKLKAAGIKPVSNVPIPESTDNIHSTHLSGAEGGLDKARIVNLRVDNVMTVVTHDNKNLAKHAEEAADYIIRALDNVAESHSGTQ